jgi:hypothetical protein
VVRGNFRPSFPPKGIGLERSRRQARSSCNSGNKRGDTGLRRSARRVAYVVQRKYKMRLREHTKDEEPMMRQGTIAQGRENTRLRKFP